MVELVCADRRLRCSHAAILVASSTCTAPMFSAIASLAKAAVGLSRGPVGVLIFLLLYPLCFAPLLLGDFLAPVERLMVLAFMLIMPFVVLGILVWLVVSKSQVLFGGDVFLQLQLATLLGAAGAQQAKGGPRPSPEDIARSLDALGPLGELSVKPRPYPLRLLWVDDSPESTAYERHAFEKLGLECVAVETTADALALLEARSWALVISDMGRREGPREGYVLLNAMRERGDDTPLVFFTAGVRPEHHVETRAHGGQGCTDDSRELFGMVVALLRDREGSP